MPPKPPIREVARVVLLDERYRILLLKYDSPVIDAAGGKLEGPSWIPPGGGVEDGETHEIAALRELQEETGVTGIDLLDWIWSRHRTFVTEDGSVPMRERYYLARVDQPEVFFGGQLPAEMQLFIEGRWWDVDDIAASADIFVPRNLAELLEPILAGDIPETPISVGR
jgi:8-oxo-dGTP pyrophosphatase MutT (NUDIX family)